MGIYAGWSTGLTCGILMFLVHFFGWWENRWMSIVRGLVEAIPLLPLMILTGNYWSILLCVGAYHGAWHLRYYDPYIGIDWWWVCLFYIGLMTGTGVLILLW